MAVAGILLGLSAFVVIIGLVSLSRARDEVMAEIATNRSTRIATYAMMQASLDAETGQRGYLLTGDREFLAPFEEGRAEAERNFALLRRTTADEQDFVEALTRAETLANRAFDAMAETVRKRNEHTLSAGQLHDELTRSKAIMDELRDEFTQLLAALERRIDRVRGRERRTTDALYRIGGALALLTLLAVALTMWALRSERKSWRAAFNALSEANAAAHEAREHAIESDLAKTRFLAVASHDMRQPLHALTLYLSALERRVEGEEARGILTKMERATNSMVSMFATLLDLARIQAGVVRAEVTDFPLQDVFDRILAEYPDGRVEAAPTSIALRTDPVLIERALSNLVSNALKHGGGSARVGAAIVGDRADISVADNGPGISEADQTRIFDEFVRLEGRSAAEGLGLGLAIVKRIADILEAPVQVVSAPGRGARFVMSAPLAGASASRTPRAETPNANLSGERVLVVDDDALAREAVSGVLRDLGAIVQAGANEAEAERILNAGFTPRLLVMDLRIDGALEGVDVGRRLRARFNPPPAMIIVTGDTGPETLTLLRTSGFQWLIKPVSPQNLSAVVAAQLRAA